MKTCSENNGHTSAITVIAMPCSMKAQSGSWIVDADGNWSNSANWLNGIIANGTGNTADFSATPSPRSAQ